MGTTSPAEDHGNDHAARIARVVEDVARRRASGEQIDVTDVIDQHPDLMPELAEQLRALGRIEQAERRAAEPRTATDNFDTIGTGETSKADPPVPSHSIPGYEILRRISEGGQGIVYQALQKTTKRRVAIKVLLQGVHASKTARKRFDREIELVAALKHPNIISIFHSSTTEAGLQFYVMDYVRGLSLNEFVREKKLTLEEALKLFIKVCAAIQYAHQRGVIHRDLKPSNILVDMDGQPKVLDFGLAKLLGGAPETIISVSQDVIGTLPYMAPEQARGSIDEIDTRTDIYALGVIIYELLTGRFPYPVLGQMAEVLKHIAETEPTPPSRAWKSDSGVSCQSSGRFRPGQCPIDGDVQTIILKSLSKDRDRRYQSAGDLARDIHNYLTGEPIEARRDSGWYVLRKMLRRHRIPALVAAAFIMVVTMASIATGVLWHLAANQRDHAVVAEKQSEQRRLEAEAERARAATAEQEAETDAETAREVLTFLVGLFEISNPNEEKGNAITARKILDRGVERIEGELNDRPVIRARLMSTMGMVYRNLGLYDAAAGLLGDALELRRGVLGRHVDVAESLNDLAVVLFDKGEYDRAEQLYREALEMDRELLGEEHEDVAAVLNNLATVLLDKGEYEEGERLHREALAMRQKLLGDDDPLVLTSLNNLAALLQMRGDYEDAEPLYREALLIKRKLLGDNDLSVLVSLNNLATLLQKKGDYAEAELLHREALAGYRRVLGDAHPNTLISTSNLGRLLEAEGKLVEAEEMFAAAVEGAVRELPEGHWLLGAFLGGRGQALTKLKRYGDAGASLLEAYRILEAALGAEHNHTVKTANAIVKLYEAWDAAEPGLGYDAKAAEWRAKLPPPDNSESEEP